MITAWKTLTQILLLERSKRLSEADHCLSCEILLYSATFVMQVNSADTIYVRLNEVCRVHHILLKLPIAFITGRETNNNE